MLTPPAVTAIGAVSGPRNTPVATVEVTFSYPVDPASLADVGAVSLTLNGNAVSTSSLTFTAAAGNSYTIGGLQTLTAGQGTYVLTFDGSKIADLAGNAGTGQQSDTWLMDTTAATSAVDSLPSQTTSTSFLVSASGNDPMQQTAGRPQASLRSRSTPQPTSGRSPSGPP